MAGPILITGISGFTGRTLAKRLADSGRDVMGFTQNKPAQDNDIQVDLTNRDQVMQTIKDVQPAAIIHLAAIAFVGHGTAGDFYSVNATGTRNLLEAAATVASPIDQVILASSANVYGNAQAGLLDETTPYQPANDYAVSKVAMEYMANLWRDRLPITITRPFNYTGRGQSPSFLVPKIVEHFKRRAAHIELGNINVSRDFSDVRDVVTAYQRILDNNCAGDVVNLCSGKSHTLLQIIDLCRDITGHELEIRINPEFVRSNEVAHLAGDTTRLHKLIGTFERHELRETLAWMLESGEH